MNPPTDLFENLSPEDAKMVLRAWEIAAEAHEGQTRRDGSPYVEHSVRVARILKDEMSVTDAKVLSAAILHDTLEDTQLPSFAIRKEFPDEVCDIVEILTKDRSAPREDYYKRFITAPRAARRVKIGDRLDNLRDLESFTAKKRERYVKDTVDHFLEIAEEEAPLLLPEIKMHCGVG